MSDLSNIALATALGAGVVSFLSPCVLPLVPGYVSYVAGGNLARREEVGQRISRLSALWLSLCFVAGFSTVFVALGAGASTLGQLLLRYRYEANIVGGLIVIAFGLFMVGALNLRWLHRDLRFHVDIKGARPLGAFYAFPNITGTGFAARELQDRLLAEAGVATIAGTSFGGQGEGYLRFSYAASIEAIGEALDRVRAWLEARPA